ncbi:peptidase S15 [Purpureocillium lavendulum]|uniref:Peptidase S15 n=1 Tax=Purpureocillium lavendulum TaxID=1247861 RepID=A0AB34FW51_9HYPO|nr:peptidase S15 [Purpureocillium lavendulum]
MASSVTESMVIERDVSIPSDDVCLRADVFRPRGSKRVPVIMTMGPYGKGIEYKSGYAAQWDWLTKTHPEILPGSTRSFMTWETVDPETWVPWGYAVIRVDSRGSGRSPGYLDILSPREARDYYNAIEWAGTQHWSNGKVGLNGISYYAVTQWQVAALQPPHLAAMIPWEGAADFYRDFARHGGIFSNVFLEHWLPLQVLSVQHGNPATPKDPWLNASASGADSSTPSAGLSPEQLARNRRDLVATILQHPTDDEFYRERSVDWAKVTVPFLSAANLAGHGLHPRGNFEAFMGAASKHKWLECHPGRHEEWFYLEEGIDIQKRFLDCFLKGESGSWMDEPPVRLRLRRPFDEKRFDVRKESSWPLPSTKWTDLFLLAAEGDGGHGVLQWEPTAAASSCAFDALGKPLRFLSPPLTTETEITGPIAAKIFASSTTTDMDLFLTLQAFSPDGREVDFSGTVDPRTPLAQGWLRASHRALDPERSLPYRPYHSHRDFQPLQPGEVYELDIEVWPTSIILPAGFRIALEISGQDFKRDVPSRRGDPRPLFGSGPFLHTHPEDRPESVYGGRTTVYVGGLYASRLVLPFIPADV